MMTKHPDHDGPGFGSALGSGSERFLARCIAHAYQVGRRTPEDFVRHFPPSRVMDALADQPNIRARILAATTGISQAIAVKKSVRSAAEDLQIALELGETTAAVVVEQVPPDDCVRSLDRRKLWAFLTEGILTESSPDKLATDASSPEVRRVKEHLLFLLECAMTEGLVEHHDLTAGIQIARIRQVLTKEELGDLVARALDEGRAGKPFTDTLLLSVVTPAMLVDRLPFRHVWDTVITARVAVKHGFVEPATASAGAVDPEPPATGKRRSTSRPVEAIPTEIAGDRSSGMLERAVAATPSVPSSTLDPVLGRKSRVVAAALPAQPIVRAPGKPTADRSHGRELGVAEPPRSIAAPVDPTLECFAVPISMTEVIFDAELGGVESWGGDTRHG